ncbi:MAG: hypothetical protein MRZ79_27330 [Bacteroidia bacterium]|nr:hypothetical protein [Bacteroidia bacterium]
MNDKIEDLIKESGKKTTVDFVSRTMLGVEESIQRKLRLRLQLLISFISVLLAAAAWVLIRGGFQVELFGVVLSLPRILTMVIMTAGAFFSILHVLLLVKFTRLERQLT